jgi:hypothetical protein
MNKTSQKWRERNPDSQVTYNENRVAREAEAGTGYSQLEVARIRKQLGDRCAYCNIALNGAGEVDHLIPIRQGGAHSGDNITLACKKCNGDKHSKTPEEFIAWRKRNGLSVRSGINWEQYRLPVTDDGVVELLTLLLDKRNAVDGRHTTVNSENLRRAKPQLLALIQRLPADERDAVSMRYGLDCSRVTTLWLIGDKLGLSQPKVSTLLGDAMTKLHRSSLILELQRGQQPHAQKQTHSSTPVLAAIAPQHIEKVVARLGPKLLEPINDQGNKEKASQAANNLASLVATANGLLGVVIITVQQYEGGPWWSRTFLAKDAALAYLKLGLPLPPSHDRGSLIAQVKKHDSEIADFLVDAQISPLAEAVADTAHESED